MMNLQPSCTHKNAHRARIGREGLQHKPAAIRCWTSIMHDVRSGYTLRLTTWFRTEPCQRSTPEPPGEPDIHTVYLTHQEAVQYSIVQWPHITLLVSVQALTNCSLIVDADATLNTLVS